VKPCLKFRGLRENVFDIYRDSCENSLFGSRNRFKSDLSRVDYVYVCIVVTTLVRTVIFVRV